MIKNFFLNLYFNIKKTPIISLAIFFQLVLTGFLLFLAIYQQTDLDIDNSYVQNAYGKYKLYYIILLTKIFLLMNQIGVKD